MTERFSNLFLQGLFGILIFPVSLMVIMFAK